MIVNLSPSITSCVSLKPYLVYSSCSFFYSRNAQLTLLIMLLHHCQLISKQIKYFIVLSTKEIITKQKFVTTYLLSKWIISKLPQKVSAILVAIASSQIRWLNLPVIWLLFNQTSIVLTQTFYINYFSLEHNKDT